MKARISCTYHVRDLMSNLAAGGDVSYDELIRWLLNNAGIDLSLSDREARAKGVELYNELQKFKSSDE